MGRLCALALGTACLLTMPRAGAFGSGGVDFLELLEDTWDWRKLDFSVEEAAFKEKWGGDYGYGGKLEEIRATDTPHLTDQVYLDYTGSGVYRASMVDAMAQDMKTNLYGNPHR